MISLRWIPIFHSAVQSVDVECVKKRRILPINFKKLTTLTMKEFRKDLYTQAEYAKKIGVSRARVSQMVKSGDLKTITINGTILIKI